MIFKPANFVSSALTLCFLLTCGFGAQAADGQFNVRDFGAAGDGKILDHQAINRAIDAAAAVGGGTVNVPAGTYLCGSIHLKSHINLHLDSGSRILGAPQKMMAYDPAEPFIGRAYQDGGHTHFHNSLIWGEDLVDVAITGQGMIDGGGLLMKADLLDVLNQFEEKRGTNVYSSDLHPTEDELRLGNKAICLKRCRRVLIRDITIFHGGHFAILTTGCDVMTIDNVTIDTNRDGMDIDCCRNVVVSNCHVNSPRDDGICPKSSFALGSNVITENLTIVNCQVSGFAEGTLLDGTMQPSKYMIGRIKFGTEANGGFRNCTVANCTFRCCRGLALEQVDGGIMENITINNITMMDNYQYAIYITSGSRNRGPAVTKPGIVRNILISNVIATEVDPMSGIEILGIPEQPIEGVRLENIRMRFKGGGTVKNAERKFPEAGTTYPEPSYLGISPAYGIFARHVRGLELINVDASLEKDDMRPVIKTEDVKGLVLDNCKAPKVDGVELASFDDREEVEIRNSKAFVAEPKK
jgi:polygalacturonase